MADWRLWIRLIIKADNEPKAALASLSALFALPFDVDAALATREPYLKDGLYSESLRVTMDGTAVQLAEVYSTLVHLSPTGWVEEMRRDEVIREAYWDHRRADEPMLDSSVAWAHMSIDELPS